MVMKHLPQYIPPTDEELNKRPVPPTNQHPLGCKEPFCPACSNQDNQYVNPHCPVCGGNGWLHPQGDFGKPIYRQVIPCYADGCHEQNLKKKESNNDVRIFATFHKIEGTESSFEAAKKFADGKIKMLLMYGEVGCGKTHLANAALHQMRSSGHKVMIRTMSSICGELKAAIKDHTVEDVVKRFKDVPVLIIDDYKSEYLKDFTTEHFEEIIDHRYNLTKFKGEDRCTFITTNNAFNDISDRISSRLGDVDIGCLVHNKASDWRSTTERTRKKLIKEIQEG